MDLEEFDLNRGPVETYIQIYGLSSASSCRGGVALGGDLSASSRLASD